MTIKGVIQVAEQSPNQVVATVEFDDVVEHIDDPPPFEDLNASNVLAQCTQTCKVASS